MSLKKYYATCKQSNFKCLSNECTVYQMSGISGMTFNNFTVLDDSLDNLHSYVILCTDEDKLMISLKGQAIHEIADNLLCDAAIIEYCVITSGTIYNNTTQYTIDNVMHKFRHIT